MRVLPALFLIVSLTSIATAEDFVVMHADFNSDTAGEWPGLDPYGDPAGDSIWFYNHIDPSSAIVHGSLYELADKPLVVSRLSGSHIQVYYSFDPEHVDCNSYTVTFDAMANNPLEYAYFTFREQGLRLFMNMAFTDDPRIDVKSQGPITLHSSAETTSVRWYEADALSFEFEIDLVGKSYSMSIDGVPVPEAQDHPFTIGNQDGTFGHMSMQFGGLQDAVMAIDNLHVVAHCGPDVGVEGTSWGSVKAIWSDLDEDRP